MRYIREALGSILEEENEEMSFDSFLDKAEVVLVDNAFDFDINKWEEKNQEEIDEELSEDTNNKIDITTSQFIKYRLTPDKVKEIVNKIINSEFNIINYWKTNQFKKKNNLTDDDLKDILRTLTEQDYKTNSISIDNSKNEAIIFIKQTNIKNLNGIELYIKLDYDSIENSPVIVISFHNVQKKATLTSSYDNGKRVNDDSYSNSELLEDSYDDDWTIDDDDIENYEEDEPITPEQEAFANEIKSLLQSLIDDEEAMDEEVIEEEFTSQNNLMYHFNKHCLGNSTTRKSTKKNIYYDFKTSKRYSKYEQRINLIFKHGQCDYIDSIYDIDIVNKKFTKLFEGNQYLFVSAIFGLKNSKGSVSLGIHAFSSDVTTNYKDGNTIDICVMTQSPKTITLYPVDASTLKNKLLGIFKNFSTLSFTPSKDDRKLLDNLSESGNEDLEETSPYTNIKSNGIYSLNTGWVKHPVQQDIPNIDMDEFEKEFKVWEDKYFVLLNELNKQNDTLNEVSEKQGELDLVKNKGIKNKIEFIEINSDCPMIDFINSIENEKLKTKTIKNIYKLADLRNKARPPLSEYIDDGIFELRTKFSSNITRAFYFFIWGDKIVMTNGYIKKSQKLDIKEFNKAKKLMNNYLKSKANLKESEDKISTISIDDYLKDCLKNEEFRKAWYSNDKEDVEKENKLEGSISDNQSKLEKIDDMIEDIYNLRKEGMEEDGEYSIKNLIFKEFRNLGYLDNLKDLRKKEISKELSLEQLQEYKDKMNIEMLKLLEYSNDVTEINQEDKKLKGEYRDLGVQGNYHIYEPLDAQAAVSLVQGFNQLFTGRAHKSDNISLLKSAKIIWNFHNENGERYFIYLSKYTNLAKYVVKVHPKLIGGYKEKFFKGCFIEETNFKIYNIKEEGLETSLDYVALSKLSLSPILNAGVDLVLNGTLFVEDKVYDIKNAKLTKIGQVEGQTFFIQTKNDYIDSTSIPISAFGTIFTEGHWRDLKKIEIPHNVKTIKNYTFSNCYTLTYMSIPNSVEEIGSYAFENCYQINAVIVPKSVKIVKSYAFNYCHNLTIYCEAESQPEGWDKDWNPDNRPVVWGYKKYRENN